MEANMELIVALIVFGAVMIVGIIAAVVVAIKMSAARVEPAWATTTTTTYPYDENDGDDGNGQHASSVPQWHGV